MIPLIDEKLEKYAYSHTKAEGEIFRELQVETHEKMAAPQMQVGRIEGQFLKILARLVGARRILEIGMFTGYSALMMAEALPEDGTLITCDIDPKAEEMAKRYFAKSPHGHKITIAMGPALETISKITEAFDMVFIDADKVNYPNYYKECLKILRPGGLIVVDNVLWSGRVLEPSDSDTQAIDLFNKQVTEDSNVENVFLTVRDGMMLIWKKSI
ncbi:MAG: class I SAM-dependent methyltransferase [Acidobacteria bacterium]|nr:class I SAM-dependent methyltransferase [Acidobacteriota bacterium]